MFSIIAGCNSLVTSKMNNGSQKKYLKKLILDINYSNLSKKRLKLVIFKDNILRK